MELNLYLFNQTYFLSYCLCMFCLFSKPLPLLVGFFFLVLSHACVFCFPLALYTTWFSLWVSYLWRRWCSISCRSQGWQSKQVRLVTCCEDWSPCAMNSVCLKVPIFPTFAQFSLGSVWMSCVVWAYSIYILFLIAYSTHFLIFIFKTIWLVCYHKVIEHYSLLEE